jgi:hypothetical protein
VKLCSIILEEFEAEMPIQYYKDTVVFKNVLENVFLKEDIISYKEKYGWDQVGTMEKKLFTIQQTRSFDLAMVTLDDLTATGKLEVIRNQELRTDIQHHYGFMVGNLDFEDIIYKPIRSYYLDLLIDLGLTPYGTESVEQIQNLAQKDPRLVSSVQHMLHGNIRMLDWAEAQSRQIGIMKDKITEEFSNLHKGK